MYMSPLILLVLDPDDLAGGEEALPTGLADWMAVSRDLGLKIIDSLIEWEERLHAGCLSWLEC